MIPAPSVTTQLFTSNDNVLTSHHNVYASNTYASRPGNQILAPNLNLSASYTGILSTNTRSLTSYINVAPQNNGTSLNPKGTSSQYGKPWQKTETKLPTSKKNESTSPWNVLSALIKDMSRTTQSNASGKQSQGLSSRSCGSSPTNVNSTSRNASASSKLRVISNIWKHIIE